MTAKKFILIAIAIISLLLTLEVLAVNYLSEKARIPQSGNVQLPADIIPVPASIDWATLANGSSYRESITLINDGDVSALLNMTYDHAIQIQSLTWDFEGQTLPAHTSQQVNFTLTTSQSGGAFNSIIHINEVG